MRKVTVPPPISQYIGGLSLSRALVVQILTRMHVELPNEYERFSRYRVKGHESWYRYRFVIRENNIRHLLTFAVDDSTSPDDLIVRAIRYDRRPRN
jgi:hypothetical protein